MTGFGRLGRLGLSSLPSFPSFPSLLTDLLLLRRRGVRRGLVLPSSPSVVLPCL